MKDMPERIWACGGHVHGWDTHIGTFAGVREPNATEYVRADKVQALVEALRVFADQEAGEIDRHLALKDARAALAAFTDGGTQG